MRSISTLIVLLVVVVSVQAQKKTSVAISISNGGLISEQLATAYYFYGATDPTDAKNFNETTLGFDLRVEIPVKEKVFISATGGYGFYRNRYTIDVSGSWGKSDQSFGRLGVGLLYKVGIEKLQLVTGLEIPFYFVGDQEYENNQMNNPGDEHRFYMKLAGGFATGLVSTTSLRYYLSEKMFFAATMSFGPMYTSLGGKTSKSVIDYVDPSREDSTYEADNNEYNSFKITKPDFSVGIGMTF